MLSQLIWRFIIELGPWLWMLAGLCLIFVEVFFARVVFLGFGLAAIVTGSTVILGQNGIFPPPSLESQIGLWMLLALALIAAIKRQAKNR